jgi:hypothetical protein
MARPNIATQYEGVRPSSYAARRIRESIEELAMPHAERALQRILDVMDSPDSNSRDILLAATQILDRAYGRAVDRVQVQALSGGGSANPEALSSQALMALVQARIQPIADELTDVVAEVPPADALTQGDV